MAAAARPRIRPIPAGRWRTNSYMVEHEGEAVLIDPGDADDAILEAIAGTVVKAIVLTHGHYDHLWGAARIAAETGAPCRVHPADMGLVRRAPLYALAFEKRPLEPPDQLVAMSESDAIQVGQLRIGVVATPGHTPGSVCLVVDDVIFTGDTLLRGMLGRTDLPGGDSVLLERSVQALLSVAPSGTKLLPGHGAEWTSDEALAWWRSRS